MWNPAEELGTWRQGRWRGRGGIAEVGRGAASGRMVGGGCRAGERQGPGHAQVGTDPGPGGVSPSVPLQQGPGTSDRLTPRMTWEPPGSRLGIPGPR